MKQNIIVLFLGLALTLSQHSLANTKLSLEINQTDFKDSRFSVKPVGISLGGEYAFNSRYSIVAKYGTNLQDDDATTEARPTNVKIKSLVGIYFKSYMSQSAKMNLFFMGGYTRTELEGTETSGQLDSGITYQEDSGFSLGLGIEYQIDRNLALTTNYNRMFDGSESKMDAMSFGVSYAF